MSLRYGDLPVKRHENAGYGCTNAAGTIRVIEVTSTRTFIVYTSGFGLNNYPDGSAIFMGERRLEDDLWFREGIADLVAVEEQTWGKVKQLFRQ